MTGKDKTVRAGKSKHGLDKEWADALAAADNGERMTASATNSVTNGNAVSSNYIPPKQKAPRTVDEDDLPSKGKKGGKKK